MANTMNPKQQIEQTVREVRPKEFEPPSGGPDPELPPPPRKPTPVKDARKNVQDERSQLMAAKTQLDMAKQARAQKMAEKITANTPNPMAVAKLKAQMDMMTKKAPAPSPAPKVALDPQSYLDDMKSMPPKPGMGTSAPVVPKPTSPNFEPGMGEPMPASKMGPPMNTPTTLPSPTVSPPPNANFMRRGGAVRSKPQTKFASGGSVGGASRRGDGIAQRGKTKGRMC